MTAVADRYEAFILDLDGVLYRGDEPVPGAPEAVAALRERGRKVVFLTNNSARTPDRVTKKLAGLGITADPREVVTSAQAAAGLVAQEGGTEATAFVVGEEGVRRALAEAGIDVVDGEPPRADFVVVGWDRHADYDKLRTASVLVQRGARLVATNSDASYPAPGGELWPGAGALLAAVETATGARAEVAGKPHRPLFDQAVRRAGTTDALVVGDRIETDIEGALSAGLDAALVLSGAAGEADVLDGRGLPVGVLKDVGGLLGEGPLARVREAGKGDAGAVAELLRNSRLEETAGGGEGTRTFVAEAGGIVATAAFDRRGEDAYLRSVAVRQDLRGNRIGVLVVGAAAQGAAAEGAVRVHLLTEAAAGFFERLGFARTLREKLPGWIQERIAHHCSPSAVAMRRDLGRLRASR